MSFLDTVGSTISGITGKVGDAISGMSGKIGNVLDPSNARLSAAELLKGGAKALGAPGFRQDRAGVRVNLSDSTPPIGSPYSDQEWRIIVSVGPGVLYKSGDAGQMWPLVETDGVVFPILPAVTTTYLANYSPQKLTHSNQPAYYYDSSEVSAINIAGDFMVQNDKEAEYLMAVISFFRAATKMYFGNSANAGNPPPIVFLDGYGEKYFDHIPCVVTSFQHVMPNDVDYYASKDCRLPTMSQIQVSLQPVMSRSKAADFNLDDFAAGRLVGRGYF